MNRLILSYSVLGCLVALWLISLAATPASAQIATEQVERTRSGAAAEPPAPVDDAGAAAAGEAEAATEGVAEPAVIGVGPLLEAGLFYAIAFAVVFSALAVCFSRNIVRMAVWLFCALGGVAMLFFLLSAPFLGVIQLIVYVGGTLILLVFGVMLTSKSPWVRFSIRWWEYALSGFVCLLLLAVLTTAISRSHWSGLLAETAPSTVSDIGMSLLSTYLLPFEAAGVLLMIVMVGAAHLARQEKK